MRIKSKNFIITIIMLVIILIFFLLYLKAPATNNTQCPPYVSTKEAMYAAWDGSVVHGSNIISLLQNSSADDAITFVIDNGVSKKEYNAFDSALTDRFAADTYINPTDMYVCVVMRNSDDKINMLTFHIVTSDK
ncbi:hypothetical protein [Butyrivibrio sp.]|uniref:hypothetical protein n=1 Tax=Butyrivibrio sp. TaxID=28121 RepID=UPI0025C4E425|nr:hypothetical protein [Butyrivibrio sp.]MBQ9303100.1 hypothetical protein [Butyrivibrio sp.]